LKIINQKKVERGWWCEENCDGKYCPIWKSELLPKVRSCKLLFP